MSQDSLLLIFFQPFENVKTTLNSVDWIWLVDHNLPTSILGNKYDYILLVLKNKSLRLKIIGRCVYEIFEISSFLTIPFINGESIKLYFVIEMSSTG